MPELNFTGLDENKAKSYLDFLYRYFKNVYTKDEIESRFFNAKKYLREDWENKISEEDFYKSTNNYIFSLMYWHSMDAKKNILKQLLSAFQPAQTVLDFGCGIGIDAIELSLLDKSVTAVDFDSKSFSAAKQLAAESNAKVNFMKIEEFKETLFDAVLLMDVIGHVPDVQKILDLAIKLSRKYIVVGLDLCDFEEQPFHHKENEEWQVKTQSYLESKGYYLVKRVENNIVMKKKIEISFAMICLNEEDKIKLWLDNHYSSADEICIVDNGSTDKTTDIIKNYPDPKGKLKLWSVSYPHLPYTDTWKQWIPRQVSFWMCTKEYILCIDADEFMGDGFRNKINYYISTFPSEKFFTFFHIPFWGDFTKIRLSHELDPGRWHGSCKGYLVKNEPDVMWERKDRHCIPTWNNVKRMPLQLKDIGLFHYHWAFGLKDLDNRRADAGIGYVTSIDKPIWDFDLSKYDGRIKYEIVTSEFTGSHPKIIEDYLKTKP